MEFTLAASLQKNAKNPYAFAKQPELKKFEKFAEERSPTEELSHSTDGTQFLHIHDRSFGKIPSTLTQATPHI